MADARGPGILPTVSKWVLSHLIDLDVEIPGGITGGG